VHVFDPGWKQPVWMSGSAVHRPVPVHERWRRRCRLWQSRLTGSLGRSGGRTIQRSNGARIGIEILRRIPDEAGKYSACGGAGEVRSRAHSKTGDALRFLNGPVDHFCCACSCWCRCSSTAEPSGGRIMRICWALGGRWHSGSSWRLAVAVGGAQHQASTGARIDSRCRTDCRRAENREHRCCRGGPRPGGPDGVGARNTAPPSWSKGTVRRQASIGSCRSLLYGRVTPLLEDGFTRESVHFSLRAEADVEVVAISSAYP